MNLGGPPRMDEDGNLIPGKLVDMVVEGSSVFIVRENFHVASALMLDSADHMLSRSSSPMGPCFRWTIPLLWRHLSRGRGSSRSQH